MLCNLLKLKNNYEVEIAKLFTFGYKQHARQTCLF